MRFPSGVTDQFIYFVAVDASDLKTRETGMTVGNLSAYRARNGAAAAAYTTPTFAEVDSTNMPGVYSLLLDEDMSIAAGNDSEEVILHIKESGGVMAPVTRSFELYRRDVSAGFTLGVASDGDISGNVDGTVADVANLSNIPSIPANWITAAGINADAITNAKIADSAFDTEQFAADFLTEALIADNAVAAEHIASAAIVAATFAANAITSTVIADNAITAAKINADAITAAKVADDVHAQIADAVVDEVLTGGTHNVTNSLGKRIRIMQESGSYEGGAVWIDTTANGTAGTTNFENGVDILPVDSIADANTIAGSVGLTRFKVAPGSAITFPGTQSNELWEGRDWTLALASRDITGSFIFGAAVSGVGTATAGYEFEECDLGAVTLDDAGHFERCSLGDTFTIADAGVFTFHNCFTKSAAAITIDFASLGGSAVHLFGFDGELNFKNMASGDTVHITGGGTITTETCTAGTIDHDGFFEYTDAGGNITEVQSDIKAAVDAIKVPTDKMVFSKANELDANTKSINDAEVIGDGDGTPWDGI